MPHRRNRAPLSERQRTKYGAAPHDAPLAYKAIPKIVRPGGAAGKRYVACLVLVRQDEPPKDHLQSVKT